jgi:UDP-N-acetylmuramoyl-tripeptide--D-alanyl-D-alanine ligase
MSDRPLWTVEAMAGAMHAARSGDLPDSVLGISIDTRTIAPGEAFFAIKGENRDGHDFVGAALVAGAGVAVVAASRRDGLATDAPLLIVPDVLAGLRDLAQAARARSQAKVVAVTGSVGKTSTKQALHLALAEQGKTHASAASYNNHWGVPLSVARCPAEARFAVFELGMNHAGEIEPLARLVRPRVAIITAVEPVHLEFFASVEAIADAKAEIFPGVERGGVAVLNRDNPHFARLAATARRAGVDRVVSFGQHADADARLLACALHSDRSDIEARILGTELTYSLGAPGRHLVLNSLAVLAAVGLIGADVRLAARALGKLRAARGRGGRMTLDVPGGAILLIDESYNANPASMRAALALLGKAELDGAVNRARARRIAVLGDMLELGPSGQELHRDLREAVIAGDVDRVFCCGPLMRALWEALPVSRRGSYAQTSAELEPHVLSAVRPGDIVMIKGSLGSRMATIVRALENRFRREQFAAAQCELRP